MQARRKEAYGRLLSFLSDARSAALFLHLRGSIEAAVSKSQKKRNEPLASFIQSKLAKLTQKLTTRLAGIETQSEDERHRTRIAAKNLRYAAEFFETLVEGKTASDRYGTFIRSLKDVQTILGYENDRIMAQRFLLAMPREIDEKQSSLIAAVERMVKNFEPRPDGDFDTRIIAAARAFVKVKPFWEKIIHEAQSGKAPMSVQHRG
jgi:triphosphatase